MADNKLTKQMDFEVILRMIEESRNRAYQKVNEELVLLYFHVGEIISNKVAEGFWGENTVDELAKFIQHKFPALKGFNRRGLYRMKQFYETYTSDEFVSTVLTQLQKPEKEASKIVSPVVTQIQKTENGGITKVSPAVTQINNSNDEVLKFVTKLLIKLSWTHHLLILSKTKTIEEKLFYIHASISEKLSKRELERQLNTAVFERTIMGNKQTKLLPSNLPQNLFKDPYIFEFLDLADGHSEKDLEKALVMNLQKFILEIGKGFAYMGNQFRLQVGNKDYYTELTRWRGFVIRA